MGASGAINAVEVRGSGQGAWEGLQNTWGAAWESYSAPNYPLDVRITNDQGQQVHSAALQAVFRMRQVIRPAENNRLGLLT